jgi:replicative DNA helicase
MNILGKVPPNSNEAELAVIGGIMLHPESLDIVVDIIVPADFYHEAHQLLFQAFIDLADRGRAIDILTVGDALKERGELERVGGIAYLSSIQDAVPTSAAIDSHAKIVRSKAMVRKVIGAALEIIESGYGDYGDSDSFLDESEARIFDTTRKRSAANLVDVDVAVKKVREELDRRYALTTDVTGIPTGWAALDRLTGGLQPADLIIVAGRPAMGKTSLALNILAHAALREKASGVIFSLEMSMLQAMSRLVSSESRVPGHLFRQPKRMTGEDRDAILMSFERMSGTKIHIDDSAELTVLDVRSRARYLKLKGELDFAIIDYLQIMRPTRRVGGDGGREREVAEITKGLKALAKELDMPVICLSQLNRACEQRQNKRPQLSDLRESGAIEQDADLVLFLYRDSVYTKDQNNNTAEVIVGKNRNGPVGTANLYFNSSYTRFDSVEENAVEPDTFGGLADRPPY